MDDEESSPAHAAYRVDPEVAAPRALRAHQQAVADLRQAERRYDEQLGRADGVSDMSLRRRLAELQERLRDAQRGVAAAERALAEVARGERALQGA